MDEFFAGEDGDDDWSGEVKSDYIIPSDEILREFIRSSHLVSPPVAQRPVEPVKQTGKGKRKK